MEGLDAISKGEYFLESSLSRQVVNRLMDSSKQEAIRKDNPYNALTLPGSRRLHGFYPKGSLLKILLKNSSSAPRPLETTGPTS